MVLFRHKKFLSIMEEFTYNTLQVQPESSQMCGQLCIFVLYRLERENLSGHQSEDGSKFEDIIFDINAEKVLKISI